MRVFRASQFFPMHVRFCSSARLKDHPQSDKLSEGVSKVRSFLSDGWQRSQPQRAKGWEQVNKARTALSGRWKEWKNRPKVEEGSSQEKKTRTRKIPSFGMAGLGAAYVAFELMETLEISIKTKGEKPKETPIVCVTSKSSVSPLFSGRSEEIDRLSKFYETANWNAPVGLVTGAPGVGKTAVVLGYIEKERSKYGDVEYKNLEQISQESSLEKELSFVFKKKKEKIEKPDLYVIDGVNSEKDFKAVSAYVNGGIPGAHVLLVGRFAPLCPSYYSFDRYQRFELSNLSEKGAFEVIQKVRKFPGYEGISEKDVEALKDSDGKYHPALLVNALNVLSESKEIGKNLYERPRLDYPALGDVYTSSLERYNNEELADLPPWIKSFIPVKPTPEKIQVLKTFGDAAAGQGLTKVEICKKKIEDCPLNKLVELSLVHRTFDPSKKEATYRIDEAFRRYLLNHLAI